MRGQFCYSLVASREIEITMASMMDEQEKQAKKMISTRFAFLFLYLWFRDLCFFVIYHSSKKSFKFIISL